MMHEQRAERFDPDSVLQAVWQHDYPPAWHVFYEKERVTNQSGYFVFFLILLILGFVLSLCFLISGINTAIAEGFSGSLIPVLATALFFVVILGVSAFLLIRFMDQKSRRASQRPISTVVVMADGVVAHHHNRTKALVFADIAHLRLRVQESTQIIRTNNVSTSYNGATTIWPVTFAVPAPATIWFDVQYTNGKRTTWPIDFAPKDLIAQYILDAYMAYRLPSADQ